MTKRRKSGKAVVFGVDEDIAGDREIPDNDVPRAIIRTAAKTPYRMVNDIDTFLAEVVRAEGSDWTEDEQRLGLCALVIKDLCGDFGLYSEDIVNGPIKWPKVDLRDIAGCADAIHERCAILMEIYPEDIRAIGEAYASAAALPEVDSKN